MKITLKSAAIISCLTLSVACGFAQVPPNGTPPPPPPPAMPGNVPPPPPDGRGPQGRRPQQQSLQTLTTISGKLVDFTTSDRGAYDGFTLQTSSQTVIVKFPEHMGETIMKSAKKGSAISLTGFNEIDPAGVTAFHLVNATVGSTQIVDTPPTPPTTITAPEQKNYSGTISDLKKDLQGNTNGVVLDKNVVVDMPPPAINQLQNLLKVGQKIDVSGFKMVPPAGVVMAQNNTVVHPQTIAINGQTYLVR